VAVFDLDAEAAKKVAADIRSEGAEAVAVAVDVGDQAAVNASFNDVRDQFGPIEILVTSAGVSGFTPFEQITLDEWNRYITVNLTGTFLCTQAAIGDMVKGGWGRIVTISSAAGQTGALRQGHYSATKGGVIAFTKTVALEYASKGITANTIPPFTIDTPMLRAAQDAKNLPKAEIISRVIPSGRVGTGDDIGATCAFLCSDAAGYITGQVVGVNGGAVM
jgi:NAD(P)-dependent dehydrogenase (short-subunit alcohol dehydrogenase family)